MREKWQLKLSTLRAIVYLKQEFAKGEWAKGAI